MAAKEGVKLSLRIAPELRGKIEAAAVQEKRSLSNMVVVALSDWASARDQHHGEAA
jgi:uncharacterized protein (DUF1778 family)